MNYRLPLQLIIAEEEGYVDYEEYDPEDETYNDEGLDDEQEMIFNE